MRRNTGVPRTYLKLAAAVLVSGAAVAACGTVKMGSAAITGDQRISAAQLSAEVSTYNAEYQKDRSKVQQQFPASQAAQQVLGWLVSFQVADRMAERYGITITPAQQRQALDQVESQVKAGNPGFTLTDLSAAIGLAPDMRNSFGRYLAIQNSVGNRLDGGKTPASGSAAQQKLASDLTHSECRAAKSLSIQVNPQFGALDYNLNQYGAYSVVAASPALSKTQSSSSSSSSSSSTASSPPRLTPPC